MHMHLIIDVCNNSVSAFIFVHMHVVSSILCTLRTMIKLSFGC